MLCSSRNACSLHREQAVTDGWLFEVCAVRRYVSKLQSK